MRAHASLRLGPLRGTTPELLASPWYGAWGFCVVWEAGLSHKTSSLPTQRRNGRACSSLTARGGGLPVGVRADCRLARRLAAPDRRGDPVDLPGARRALRQPQRLADGTAEPSPPDFQAAVRCGVVLPLHWPLCRARSPSQVWRQGGLRRPPHAVPQRDHGGGAYADLYIPD